MVRLSRSSYRGNLSKVAVDICAAAETVILVALATLRSASAKRSAGATQLAVGDLLRAPLPRLRAASGGIFLSTETPLMFLALGWT